MNDGPHSGRGGTEAAGLGLRERKKLRTRRALVDEALRLFTEKGFAEATLDELVDAVEVSQRTFFRNFGCKEDVALAPEKELWAAYVADIESRPPGSARPVDFADALFAAVRDMAEGWESRFLASRALCDRTPALVAHSLRHCAEVTDHLLNVLAERRPGAFAEGGQGTAGAAPGGAADRAAVDRAAVDPEARLRLFLRLEATLAAWRWAVREWSAQGAAADREALYGHMRAAFAALPDPPGPPDPSGPPDGDRRAGA
ncbi:TetR/AcrR family transcriptional regulator [Streptomyces marincola]|uniref:TetR/AcrR family transcriptional regulator n=1 Tax=Streptomyces marincola TaxID=2878388 RepID=UPI001CF28688|nr:TetR/AcrR family transcriptional regulator [Streptomyces marincola]UCM88438.1 TetR/AcrR family transcriptional regulator [Streptomyces marincola]